MSRHSQPSVENSYGCCISPAIRFPSGFVAVVQVWCKVWVPEPNAIVRMVHAARQKLPKPSKCYASWSLVYGCFVGFKRRTQSKDNDTTT